MDELSGATAAIRCSAAGLLEGGVNVYEFDGFDGMPLELR